MHGYHTCHSWYSGTRFLICRLVIIHTSRVFILKGRIAVAGFVCRASWFRVLIKVWCYRNTLLWILHVHRAHQCTCLNTIGSTSGFIQWGEASPPKYPASTPPPKKKRKGKEKEREREAGERGGERGKCECFLCCDILHHIKIHWISD